MLISLYQTTFTKLRLFEGIAPLLMRLYLAPVMLQAGWNKVTNFDSIVTWFGNAEWGLGLPFPTVMAGLATGTELIGGALLLAGLLTRLISIPLMITMLVAALSVHWENGWLAIADSSSWLANGTLFYNPSVVEAAEKLDAAKSILQQHGNYEWLTSSGNFVILNNGVEFAITYFIMLLALLFIGGGRFVSLDYWLKKWIN
ncbi:HvfX family Cu-binding RiPP maturation protein [Alteromonas oceanisediminis]|uniref:HvfX family Cu-binding RiPP maturation protein n=1 Tax=Alteromonas oceanisediminis TaxID=2836180 RepID=UPI001BDB2163|nr:DoxX family protein [Alteromonas oceanisediminis]MBT0586566.1 DoxX family protein [Alteromonas oceanisediminis]